MPDQTLSCREVRLRMHEILRSEPSPALAAHLAGCPACLEACVDAAQRLPPEVQVPASFRDSVLAKLPPAQPAEPAGYPWSVVLAASLFAVFGLVLWRSGNLSVLAGSLIAAIAHPAILAAATAVEAAAALWWLWRVYTRQS